MRGSEEVTGELDAQGEADGPRPWSWRLAQAALIGSSLAACWLLVDFLASWAETEQLRNGSHRDLVAALERSGVITRPRPGILLEEGAGLRAARGAATPLELDRARSRLEAGLGAPVHLSSGQLQLLAARGFESAGLPPDAWPSASDVLAFEGTVRSLASRDHHELFLLSPERGAWWALLHGDPDLSLRELSRTSPVRSE